jgi:aminoglycoside phosphotransferase (APT) family kinase protein
MGGVEPEITTWLEEVAGGEVVSLHRVPGGGRIGFWVDVKSLDGDVHELFLQRGGRSGSHSFIGFERQAEVYRALEPLGIPIPHVWGADDGWDVFLVDRARGQTWFRAPTDPAVAQSVAGDFMDHLAAWHRAGARSLDLPSFGPVRTIRHHQLEQLAGIKASFEADGDEPVDLLASVQLDHLLHHVPDADGEPVLVQGDTGPGNFLYDGGRVTAIVDWELAHLGDPMDDIAWLSWRATQHGWPDFPARLRQYQEASGITVDPGRVMYYRLNACARLGRHFGLATMGPGTRRGMAAASVGADASVDRAADGSRFIMDVLHRRMRLTAQADAMGIDLPGRDVGVEAAPRSHATLYDEVLDQLSGIVEASDDRATASRAKGAARQVKYLKEIDRNGALFDAHELDDIGRLLGRTPRSLDDGRQALAASAREGRIDFEDYFHYHWERLIRDDWLMRRASGALYERGWPALV